MTLRILVTSALLSFFGAGCALTSKSDSVILRYFALDSGESRPPHVEPAVAKATAPLQLRLGRVNAAGYLRDRIAYRDSKVEVGYYDDLRWTEKPEAYVRRALARALFEDHGVAQVIAGFGPTLEVDLNAFEELKASHAVRVEMTWILRDEQLVSIQDTFAIERPIAQSKEGSAPADIAMALSAALDEAVKKIVARVLVALASKPDAAAASASRGAP